MSNMPEAVKNHGDAVGQIAAASVNTSQRRGFVPVDKQMPAWVQNIVAIDEVALAIELGCDAVDIGKTLHPSPTLGKSVGMAAKVAHGSCTDLPMKKK